MRAIAGVVCSLACVGVLSGQSGPMEMTRPIELSDLWSIRTFTRVEISPDGKYVFFSITPTTESGKDEFKLFDTHTGEIQDIDFGEIQPGRVMWDGTADGLFFLASEQKKVSFWRWDRKTRKSAPVFTHDQNATWSSNFYRSTTFSNYAPSLDGTRIAFVSAIKADDAENAEREHAMKTGGFVLSRREGTSVSATPTEVWVWERSTGAIKRVYAGPDVWNIKWSPDGSKLALWHMGPKNVVIVSESFGGMMDVTRVSVVDVKTGRRQLLGENEMRADSILAWGPGGQSLVVNAPKVMRHTSSPLGDLWLLKSYATEHWTWDSAHEKFQLAAKPLQAFANLGGRRPPETLEWHENGRIYYSDMVENRTEAIIEIQPGGQSHTLTPARWHVSKSSIAAHAQVAAVVRESVNEPQELALVDLRSRELKTVTSFNAHAIKLQRPKVEPYRVVNKFGYTTENWLIRPFGYREGQRYPLVVLLYNYNNVFPAQSWMKNIAPFEYARLGMAVLLANYPAYDGAQAEGRRTTPEKMRFGVGINPLASFEAAVDKLIGEGVVDPSKVGISGFSYGGFLTQYAITHSSKFSAAFVNDGGAWNPIQYYLATQGVPRVTLAYNLMFGGAPFGRGAKAMQEFMPAYGFGRLAVPVLIEGHGRDKDRSMSDVYVTARMEGTPIEMVIYDDAHQMTNRKLQMSSIHRNADWFRYWLLGTKNPNPMDNDQYTRWDELQKQLVALKKTGPSRP